MRDDAREAVCLPEHVWDRPETRVALRDRRIAHLFLLAQKYAGASQTRIAAVLGMDQSEVSRIKSGDRRVTAIDVLERVADGFCMPDQARMLLGLAPQCWAASDAAPASPAAIAAEPARSPDAVPFAGRLAAPLTEFVGRTKETRQVAELLADRRLVTLVGPPGIGKTRLCLAVAAAVEQRFPDGVVLVPLAQAGTAEQVVSALAHALAAPEEAGRSRLDTVIEHLAGRHLLLVLDNFEQALAAAPAVAELLAAAPRVRALTTSRERLRLSGEQVYAVPPLSLPDLGRLPSTPQGVARTVAGSSALSLFAVRARQVAYGFTIGPASLPLLAELCHRLDGLPLAIELAAARSDQFTPAELLAQLNRRLDLLSEGPRDVPVRQRTLRGALDWSFGLLDDAARSALAQLGVFAGGCTDRAAAAVVEAGPAGSSAALLAALADKSMLRVQPDPDGGTRYVMLDTIRAYALEQLERGGAAGVARARHARYFAELAERAAAELTGPGQGEWLDRIEREHHNLRAAMDWSLQHGEPRTAARIGAGIWRFWSSRNLVGEGRAWMLRVLAAPGELPDRLRSQVLYGAAVLTLISNELGAELDTLLDENLRLADRLGDLRAEAETFNLRGIVATMTGDDERARAYCQESLALWREIGDQRGIGVALGNLAEVAIRLGDLDTARPLVAESLERDRQTGDTRGILVSLGQLGRILLARGQADAARPLFEESLALSRQVGDAPNEAAALRDLGEVAELDGQVGRAVRLVVDSMAMLRKFGERDELAAAMEILASLLTGTAPATAARMLGASEELRAVHGLPLPALRFGRWRAARDRLRAALGEDGFAAAWEAGRATSFDTIVTEALAMQPDRGSSR